MELGIFRVFCRWCVLTGNSLDYYKSYVKNSPKFGFITLNSLCSVLPPEEREPGKIQKRQSTVRKTDLVFHFPTAIHVKCESCVSKSTNLELYERV